MTESADVLDIGTFNQCALGSSSSLLASGSFSDTEWYAADAAMAVTNLRSEGEKHTQSAAEVQISSR